MANPLHLQVNKAVTHDSTFKHAKGKPLVWEHAKLTENKGSQGMFSPVDSTHSRKRKGYINRDIKLLTPGEKKEIQSPSTVCGWKYSINN